MMSYSFDEALSRIQNWKPSDEERARIKDCIDAHSTPQPTGAMLLKNARMSHGFTVSNVTTGCSRALLGIARCASGGMQVGRCVVGCIASHLSNRVLAPRAIGVCRAQCSSDARVREGVVE